MFDSIKGLIVVLTIGLTIFHLARPIALHFIRAEDFSRRRLVWLILTAAFFVSPNFWVYTLVAVPVLIWANRRDSNPIALYLCMLHVIPPVAVAIPILGNNGLFPLDNYRLLALCVLLPAAARYRKQRKKNAAHGRLGSMDFLLLAYGVLVVALYLPPDLPHHFIIPDSFSNALRRAVLFLLDVYLLYFAVSRTCDSRQKLVDAVATFCLVCAVMAALALFENMRNWLLYTDIATRWTNDPHAGFYLTRGGAVRAQTSTGHSIAQGYLFAVAFGFWLHLMAHAQSRAQKFGPTVLLLGGLYATTSRGAWLGAAGVYFMFLAAGPRAVSRIAKGTALCVAMGGVILLTPLGDRLLDMLPESGKPVDVYRHELSERGWAIVMEHPLLGDQFPYPEMEDLRQGEGIIDIVNTYVGEALNHGLIGLFCFLSFILIGAMRVYKRSRELFHSDPDLASLGIALIACIVGTLIIIDSDSFNLAPQKMFYVLAGLTTAYIGLAGTPQHLHADQGAREKMEG